MTEIPSHRPSAQLVSREQWSEYSSKIHDADSPYPYGEAFHLYPETIRPDNAITAAHGLEKILNTSRRPDGTFLDHELVDALGAMSFWNGLAAGSLSLGERHSLFNDPSVKNYIDNRAASIEEQNQDLIEDYPDIAQKFREGIAEGRKLGFVPEEVTDQRILDTTSNVGILISDSAILHSDHPTTGAAGDYNGQLDRIRIGSDVMKPKHTTIHELRHKIGGGTFTQGDDLLDISDIVRTRVGFQEKGRHRAIDEALVEHATEAILNGDWYTLDPRERKESSEVYLLERVLLAELIRHSGGILKLETLSRASLEDTHSKGGVAERRQMMRQFRKAYGPGAAHRYDKLVEGIIKTRDDKPLEQLLSEFLSYIKEPVIDESENVTEAGHIDYPQLDS